MCCHSLMIQRLRMAKLGFFILAAGLAAWSAVNSNSWYSCFRLSLNGLRTTTSNNRSCEVIPPPHLTYSHTVCVHTTTSNYGLYLSFYKSVKGFQHQHLPLSQDHPWPSIPCCCQPIHRKLTGHPKLRLAPDNEFSMQLFLYIVC